MEQHRPTRDGRRSAESWEDAALDAIAESGLRSLAIPALAETLGVTKGSFYWHFDALDSLIAAALKRWENADRATLDELAKVADPSQRLRAAFAEAMRLERAQALYVTLSATASDRRVTQVLRRVSQRRVRFLIDAYDELGLPRAEARQRALLAYSAYIGIIHLRRQALEGVRTERDVRAYVRHAERTLIPRRSR